MMVMDTMGGLQNDGGSVGDAMGDGLQEQGGHKRFLRLASIFKNFCCQSLNFLSYLP
jgi:hypothetical protein